MNHAERLVEDLNDHCYEATREISDEYGFTPYEYGSNGNVQCIRFLELPICNSEDDYFEDAAQLRQYVIEESNRILNALKGIRLPVISTDHPSES